MAMLSPIWISLAKIILTKAGWVSSLLVDLKYFSDFLHLELCYLTSKISPCLISSPSAGEFKLNIECNHATLSGHRWILHCILFTWDVLDRTFLFKFDVHYWNCTCSLYLLMPVIHAVVIMSSKLQGSMGCWVILMQILVILKLVSMNSLLFNKERDF